jgi:hypothetical protein
MPISQRSYQLSRLVRVESSCFKLAKVKCLTSHRHSFKEETERRVLLGGDAL